MGFSVLLSVLLSAIFVLFVIDVIIFLLIDDMTFVNDYYQYYSQPDTRAIESVISDGSGFLVDVLIPFHFFDSFVYGLSLILYVGWYIVMPLGITTFLIYLMFNWTTQYNLQHFKYKNKKDWKKSLNNDYNDTENMKKELKVIGSEIKQEIKSIPSKVSPKAKTGDDETIVKISKYHDLMEKGMITAEEFEVKKAALLNLDK